jgi:N-glycosylase/DNA lyase
VTTRLQAPGFDLRHTLECGQFFRWTRTPDGYFVHVGGLLFAVRQHGDELLVEGAPASFARRFFSLDHDAPLIEEHLLHDRRLRESVEIYRGLRILRQDPWECTVAFLTSAASNIPRIAANLADIAQAYGRPTARGGFQSFTFPRPDEIGNEEGLRKLRLGFRARYLVEAARLTRAGLLEDLEDLPYEEAREALMVVPGIADKIADCILLYAFGHLNAFPVDTWIRRVMQDMFFQGRKVPDSAIRELASERWGDWAGYAQQYLYIWARERRPVIYRETLAAGAV